MIYPAYPNPFNPVTRIPFNLPVESRVSIKVYNVLGEEVCELINRTMMPGFHEIAWDGKNMNNLPVASGTYIYQIVAWSVDGKQQYSQSNKMLVDILGLCERFSRLFSKINHFKSLKKMDFIH